MPSLLSDNIARLDAIRHRISALSLPALNIGDSGDGAILFLLEMLDAVSEASCKTSDECIGLYKQVADLSNRIESLASERKEEAKRIAALEAQHKEMASRLSARIDECHELTAERDHENNEYHKVFDEWDQAKSRIEQLEQERDKQAAFSVERDSAMSALIHLIRRELADRPMAVGCREDMEEAVVKVERVFGMEVAG